MEANIRPILTALLGPSKPIPRQTVPTTNHAGSVRRAGGLVKVVDYGGAVSLVPLLRSMADEGIGALKRSGRPLLRALGQRERNSGGVNKPGGKVIILVTWGLSGWRTALS